MPQANLEISRDDYLAQDAQSDTRLEFFEGQIFAIAGGTFKHAQVAGNIYSELRQGLKGKPCQPMNSDMRVHTPSGLDTYPDISVYCGDLEAIVILESLNLDLTLEAIYQS
jgi:Uma2 family endonuclease